MDSRTLFKILFAEFDDKLARLKNLVDRTAQFPNAPEKIKVAIGIRRSGKTVFLYQYILQLLKEGVSKTSILYINFEDDRLLPQNHLILSNLVDAFYSTYPENHERKCYFFFDEIQHLENWPLVIRRLHDSKNIEIFLTGSSAKLLSKEIATSLRGRSLSTEIWPYSFQEFMKAKKISIDRTLFGKKTQDQLTQVFHQYLNEGGFPEVISKEIDVRQKTLQEYVDVVIYRDIIERHEIKNPSVIKYMILSMIYHAAKPYSINKLYNDLKSRGFSIAKDALYEYADHIEDAYLAFSVPLFDKSIRKIETNPRKNYIVDPGMARALTLDYENDLGRLFENIVYLDLKRLGCKVNYFLTSQRHEIDFLAQTAQGKKKFFQVVWEMNDPETMVREERALKEGMEELKIEGEIITLLSYLEHGIRF